MFSQLLASEAVTETIEILKNEFLLATWETIYVTILSTLFSIIIACSKVYSISFILASSFA